MTTATIARGLTHIRAEIARLRKTDFALSDYETAIQDTILKALAAMRSTGSENYNPKVTWRLRMMLHAAGSTTLDGSDLSTSDFGLLVLLDQCIAQREQVAGPEEAERALYNVVRILEAEDEAEPPTQH